MTGQASGGTSTNFWVGRGIPESMGTNGNGGCGGADTFVRRAGRIQRLLAACLFDLGRLDEALVLNREVYARTVAVLGKDSEEAVCDCLNVANTLRKLRRFAEAATLARDQLPSARSLGNGHELVLLLSRVLADSLCQNPDSSRDDVLEAISILQKALEQARRTFGATHPRTRETEAKLGSARHRAREFAY